MKKSYLFLLPVMLLTLAMCYFSSCNNRTPSGGGGGTTEAPAEASRTRCDTLKLRQNCYVIVRDTVWGRKTDDNSCWKGVGICYGPVDQDGGNAIVVGVTNAVPIEGGGCPCPR